MHNGYGMFGPGSEMMWGMDIIWLLILVVLVLTIAALIKYLFSGGAK